MAEIKTSRKDHDVKGVVQAQPFQLCHMRQVESVCVRATNPVHSALAAWVALLAHAGLRAEDSQRFKKLDHVGFYRRCGSWYLPEP